MLLFAHVTIWELPAHIPTFAAGILCGYLLARVVSILRI